MEQVTAVDPYTVAAGAIILLLVASVAVLFAMRDTRSEPKKLVTRFVRCPDRRRPSVVTFVESMRGGVVTRSVQSCSQLEVGERCDQRCAHLSQSELCAAPSDA